MRTHYGKANEDRPFQEWFSGKAPGMEWFKPWLKMMRTELATGKRIKWVRFINDPPSDYLRWELWGSPYNLGVGKDIRYLPRTHPIVAELPDHDLWVLGRRPGVAAFQTRDSAWHHALTFTEYMATKVE